MYDSTDGISNRIGFGIRPRRVSVVAGAGGAPNALAHEPDPAKPLTPRHTLAACVCCMSSEGRGGYEVCVLLRIAALTLPSLRCAATRQTPSHTNQILRSRSLLAIRLPRVCAACLAREGVVMRCV